MAYFLIYYNYIITFYFEKYIVIYSNQLIFILEVNYFYIYIYKYNL